MFFYSFRKKKREIFGVTTPNLQLQTKLKLQLWYDNQIILMAVCFSVIWSNRDKEVVFEVWDNQPGKQISKMQEGKSSPTRPIKNMWS